MYKKGYYSDLQLTLVVSNSVFEISDESKFSRGPELCSI